MDIATELTYVTRSVGRPGFYNYKPPEDAPEVAPETRRYDMIVRDARAEVHSLDLDKEGLTIVTHNTGATDLYEEAQVREIYFPEVEALVALNTGASRVIAFDYNVRNKSLS